MKSVITAIFALIALTILVSCNQQAIRDTPAINNGTTMVSTPSPSTADKPLPSITAKEGYQTALARIRATKTAKTTLTPPTSTLTPSNTFTPSATFTPSTTPFPSKTPQPSVKPAQSPTLTITPTFDSAKIITYTPAPLAVCPKSNPSFNPPDFENLSTNRDFASFWKNYLEFLNSGGTVEALTEKWRPTYQVDLTNNGVPEYVVQKVEPFIGFSIFGCQNGAYQSLSISSDDIDDWDYPEIIAMPDGNLNNIPEIILLVNAFTQNISAYGVFEWDGEKFTSIVTDDMYSDHGEISWWGPLEQLEIRDIDRNGTKELIWSWDKPVWQIYVDGLPWRKETHIYMWNGDKYTFYKMEYSPPEYRFQAVQDGDTATLTGDYDKALDLYQQAIFSDQLDWWSQARREYEKSLFPMVIEPTPMDSLQPDPDEYPNLAAYARYRIMLLHVVRGWNDEALVVYSTLQEKYPEGQAGYTYTQLAELFWTEYQTSDNIGLACDKVLAFAEQHQSNVFKYIGYYYDGTEDYHGDQSRALQHNDICPFR